MAVPDEDHEIAPLVIIESPFSGDVVRNKQYLTDAILDCIRKGENPYASHQMLTGALDDTDAKQSSLGMQLGMQMYNYATKCVVYLDLGMSRGMGEGVETARQKGVPVVYRSITKWASRT